MKTVLFATIILSLAAFALAACPYNDCHHPQWPHIATGNCSVATSTCMCNQGFGGAGCSQVTGCPASCNNGNCQTGKCVCDSPWTGPLCDVKTCTNDCNNNGLCNNGTCTCYPGFNGAECAGASVPTVSGVAFGSRWRSLEISFSADTNLGGMTATNCDSVITTATLALLGTGPKCSWASPKKLVVNLPYDTTVVVNSAFSLKSGVIKDRFGVTGITTGLTQTVQAAGSPLSQDFHYIAPETVGPCDDLVIDATISRGTAARPATFNFAVLSGTNITVPASASKGILRISGADLTRSVVNPSTTTIIKFTGSVTNVFGATSSVVTITVVRKPTNLATVTILRPKSDYVASIGENILFETNVQACGLGANPSVSYKWTIYGNTLGAALQYSTTGSSLLVNPGVFTPGKNYVVQVSTAIAGQSPSINGTASVVIQGVYSTLNSMMLPSSIDKASTASGFGLTAMASAAFTDFDATIAGLALTFECQTGSSGTWVSGCLDRTQVPSTNLASPTGTGATRAWDIAANKLSPGRYRFRFTTAATSRSSATSEWSVVTVTQSMTDYPSVSGFKYSLFRSVLSNVLYLPNSDKATVGIKALCATCTAMTLGGSAYVSGGVSSQVVDSAMLGRTKKFMIAATAGGTTSNVELALPIGLAPMAGLVTISPANGTATAVTDLTLTIRGFHQPGHHFAGIISYDFDSGLGMYKLPVITKKNLPTGVNNIKVTVLSELGGKVVYSLPPYTVVPIGGSSSSQVTTVTTKLDSALDDALTSNDPNKQATAVATSINILKDYDTLTLTPAAIAKFEATLTKSADLLKKAAAALTTAPNVDVVTNLVLASKTLTSLVRVKSAQVESIVEGLETAIGSVDPLITPSNPLPTSTIDSVLDVLNSAKGKLSGSLANGKKITTVFTNLGKTVSKQLATGESVTATKSNVAFRVEKIDTVSNPTGAVPFEKPSTAGKSMGINFTGGVPSTLTTAIAAQMNFNIFATYPTGVASNETNGPFFTLKFLTAAGTPINDVSDPTQGGKTGSKVDICFDFVNRTGLIPSLYKFLSASIVPVTNATYNVAKAQWCVDATKFSDFAIFPVELPKVSEIDETIIALVVVFGVLFIVGMVAVIYKKGPGLESIRESKRQTASGNGKGDVFYDPSAEPGEQWVDVGTGAKK